MAEGEHLSEQTRKLWKKPLEGTTKHPQGRLFAPVGDHKGDPWKLAPENWLGQSDSPAHEDIISWHGSEESSLPRTDEYEHRSYDASDFAIESDVPPGEDELEWWRRSSGPMSEDDYSVDSKERPMTEYGSAVGMHFGSLAAASDRAPRPFLHPARIPKETLVDPPNRSFSTPKPGGAIVSGSLRSEHDIVNSQTGERTPDERWSDIGANYAEKATDLVEKGKTLAYRNDVEARGSTSFRTLPETARTWSEDVMSAKRPGGSGVAGKFGWHDDPHAFRNTPHPALVAAAEAGYDPVVLSDSKFRKPGEGVQPELPFSGGLNDNVRKADIEDSRVRTAEFQKGTTWTMRKPDSA